MRRVPRSAAPLFAATRRCAATPGEAPSKGCNEEDVVTPWSVTAAGPRGVDYGRVLTRFRSQPVDAPLLQQLERVCAERAGRAQATSPAEEAVGEPKALHHFFRRGIVFSHRDFGDALECVRASFTTGAHRAYLYTGRGPSARSMHIGHAMPFLLTRYLQDALGLPLVVQIADDEKYFFRDIPVGGTKVSELAVENIKDIIAFGFDPRKTFIFCNTAYMGDMYPTVVRVQRMLTLSAVKNTFGLRDSDNVGKAAYPAVQAAPCFSSAFPRVLRRPAGEPPLQCVVPCAIDQDPFFLLTRNVASRMKCRAPALLHTKFLPALKGLRFKMSSSAEANGVITLHDTEQEVQRKMRRAFSGGGGTLEDMRGNGANLHADVAYQFIRFFCPDDDLVAEVAAKYGRGEMHSVAVKDLAADVVVRHVLSEWQARRANVTDADVEDFTGIRNIML
ncbi:tryptophanyl-tRNA synthetase [Trypanosoma rangeli]|uniref:tryptophan--tRNA ligase n=1 Tax=Trypanosoma rangeli TaxID=5698 RepID=A0A422NW64_TRYRA|nr:tryptophanyl-tRNA synthetase [Trypanosoma rangeli]RNF09675.1 tryptophanyl-tRNA synthetase [Trypanosoma rangeli]|eukprot:RNF09675.1 tryptophanyl-tRNA synthetase [Trypanosoma rangeli]